MMYQCECVVSVVSGQWSWSMCLFQATAEANNLAAVAGAKHAYVKEMEQVSTPGCNTSDEAIALYSELL